MRAGDSLKAAANLRRLIGPRNTFTEKDRFFFRDQRPLPHFTLSEVLPKGLLTEFTTRTQQIYQLTVR